MPWNPADPDNRPVVLIVRRPDDANDIHTYAGSGEPLVIDLDLGSGFDVSHPEDADLGDGTLEEVRDWLEGRLEDIKLLPEDHPARADMQAVLEEVRDVYGLDEDNQ